MYREIQLVRPVGRQPLGAIVIQQARLGWKLYGSPFDLAGQPVQPMVKDDDPLPTEVGEYQIIEKSGVLTVPAQIKELHENGWLFHGFPFSLNNLGAIAMVYGNVPQYVAMLEGASCAFNGLREELDELTELVKAGGGAAVKNTGYFSYYNNSAIQKTSSGIWGGLINNGLNSRTQTAYGPQGVTTMLDSTTGRILLNSLSIGDQVEIQHVMKAFVYTNNMELTFRHIIGQTGSEYSVPVGPAIRMQAGAGVWSDSFIVSGAFTVSSATDRVGGALLQIKSGGVADIDFENSYIRVTRNSLS